MLVACVITGVIGGAATAGVAIPVILTGCAAVAGITIVGAGLYALAAAVWDCS